MNEISLQRGQRIFVETSIANQLIEYASPSLLRDLSIRTGAPPPAREPEYARSLILAASSPLLSVILSEGAHLGWAQMQSSDVTSDDIEAARFTRNLIKSHAASPISEGMLRMINGKVRGLPNPSATPYRSVLTWVGGQNPSSAALVPAPPDQIEEYLADLVAFLQREDVPESLALPMAYYQFLTVHPFKDANGRVARLLVALQSHRRQMSSTQGIILAVGLSAKREAVTRYFAAMFDGNCDPYLTFWAMLERWCASVTEFAIRSLFQMRAVLDEGIGSIKWKGGFTSLVELAPSFLRADFNSIVRGSDRLTQRYLLSLEQDQVIRRVNGREKERWECLDATAHWVRVRNFAATTLAQTAIS